MSSKEKLIITAAITGSRIMREKAPYIPYTPEEIVESSMECWRAGASIVHIHVRDPKTGLGTQDLDLFQRVVTPLREKIDIRKRDTACTCLRSFAGWPAVGEVHSRLLPAKFDNIAELRQLPRVSKQGAGSCTLLIGRYREENQSWKN